MPSTLCVCAVQLILLFYAELTPTRQNLLTILTLLPTPAYLFLILPWDPLLGALSITSLLSTAYTLLYIPPNDRSRCETSTPCRASGWASTRRPIDRWLAGLNGAVCALVLLYGLRPGGRTAGLNLADVKTWLSVVPALLLATATLARREIRAVDVNVDGLEELKYEYKGA